MEKYIDMISPLTGGRVKEVNTIEEKEFRKEKFLVHVRYCVCEDTGEQFTTTEQDTMQFNDLYSQYRVKHGIPFSDEIRDIRKRYGLNYSQMSRLLGFGANQYAKYENGEVPSESNGKMIAAIKDKEVLLGLLKGSKSAFSTTEYKRILSTIALSEVREDDNEPLFLIIFKNNDRSVFNGYGYKNIRKLFEMVRNIVRIHGEIFPTKLNKLMYYTDFYHYRKSGISISGLQYRALNFGPVPDHYATIYDNTPGLDKRLIEAHDMVSTLLTCEIEEDCEILSTAEKESIDFVVEKLRPLTVAQIIEASHEETGWLTNAESRAFIPYDAAFDLKLL